MSGRPPGFIRVGAEWSPEDRRGALRFRLGRSRTSYRTVPGLYAMGRPGEDAPVLATANLKLTFDILRRDLAGVDAWILVLETSGMGVGCGVAVGSFSTEELSARIQKTRLADVVRHRRVVVPGLAAQGLDGGTVARHTGFELTPGPVRSRDIPAWLRSGRVPSPRMGAVRFDLPDRLVLAPRELAQSLMRFPAFAFAALLFAGLGPGGVNLGRSLAGGWPLLVLGMGSICAGSLLLPLLLPLVPLLGFALRGVILGAAVNALLLHAAGIATGMDPYLLAACWLFFPAASGLLALQFGRSTPTSGTPDARAETRAALPVMIALSVLVLAALALSKAATWGR